jgi:hypothetical protein
VAVVRVVEATVAVTVAAAMVVAMAVEETAAATAEGKVVEARVGALVVARGGGRWW